MAGGGGPFTQGVVPSSLFAALHPVPVTPGEVRGHGGDAVLEGGVLGVAGAGQLQLLRGVGQLEGRVGVGGVRQQGALPLQQLGHAFQQFPEAEGQGRFPQPIQLLRDTPAGRYVSL